MKLTFSFQLLALVAWVLDWTFPLGTHFAFVGLSAAAAHALAEPLGEPFFPLFVFFVVYLWTVGLIVKLIGCGFGAIRRLFTRPSVTPPPAVVVRVAPAPVNQEPAAPEMPTMAMVQQLVVDQADNQAVDWDSWETAMSAAAEGDASVDRAIDPTRRLGVVKSFMRGQGWGLIEPVEPVAGSRVHLYVHASRVLRNGKLDVLDEGARVEFEVMRFGDRVAATNVAQLD